MGKKQKKAILGGLAPGDKLIPEKSGSRWGLYAAFGALLIALVGVVLILRPSRAPFVPEVTGAPRVAVDQESMDFGRVALNTPVRANFVLRNVGDQPLTLLELPQIEVKEGC